MMTHIWVSCCTVHARQISFVCGLACARALVPRENLLKAIGGQTDACKRSVAVHCFTTSPIAPLMLYPSFVGATPIYHAGARSLSQPEIAVQLDEKTLGCWSIFRGLLIKFGGVKVLGVN